MGLVAAVCIQSATDTLEQRMAGSLKRTFGKILKVVIVAGDGIGYVAASRLDDGTL